MADFVIIERTVCFCGADHISANLLDNMWKPSGMQPIAEWANTVSKEYKQKSNTNDRGQHQFITAKQKPWSYTVYLKRLKWNCCQMPIHLGLHGYVQEASNTHTTWLCIAVKVDMRDDLQYGKIHSVWRDHQSDCVEQCRIENKAVICWFALI